VIVEITERKQSEKQLKLLSAAIEQADESIVITDTEASIQYVNPAFEKITGYSITEAIGQNPRILQSGTNDALIYRTMWDKLSSGQTWKGHFVNKKKDGTLYDEDANISPIRNTENEIINYVAVKRDITKELRKEEQLRQAQKMESIGTLAGGIAHDFNNILGTIMGYTELSVDEVDKDSNVRSSLLEILNATNRAKDLVQQILSFSRQTTQQKKPIKIVPIVKETIKFIRATIPTTIDIHYNIGIENDIVIADPTQIHQVLMNLCTNAGHAMEEKGGELNISITETNYDFQIDQQLEQNSRSYIKITVSDTGHGIGKEILEKIFNPYFTTKKKGQGTGLGLAVVHGIVKDHGGIITVNSKKGERTNFEVFLPLSAKKEPVSDEIGITAIVGTNEKILLVDDENSLLEITRRMLERLGYDVVARTSSVEALAKFNSAPQNFDLIITDKTMPNMTGFDLAQEIKKTRPDIPIIMCTGFSEEISPDKLENIGLAEIVMKPISNLKIAKIIRKVLDKEVQPVMRIIDNSKISSLAKG